jgi:hypothetical protein
MGKKHKKNKNNTKNLLYLVPQGIEDFKLTKVMLEELEKEGYNIVAYQSFDLVNINYDLFDIIATTGNHLLTWELQYPLLQQYLKHKEIIIASYEEINTNDKIIYHFREWKKFDVNINLININNKKSKEENKVNITIL